MTKQMPLPVLSLVLSNKVYRQIKIVILMRSVTSSGQVIADVLEKKDIPIRCPILSRGGKFTSEFIVPILDWLRVEHPLPKNQTEEIEEEQKARHLFETIKEWISAKQEDIFWDDLNRWREMLDAKKDEAYDLRGRLYDFLNTCEIRLAHDDSDLIVSMGIASQIIRSVEEIHRRRLTGQERRTPRGLLSEAYFALMRKQQDFGESMPVDVTDHGVTITTVHQAKGLEWPIVIIPMLNNRRFPLSPRHQESSYPDEIAGRYGTSTEDERRLFYVAVTRATQRLFLLDSTSEKMGKRSLFLNELDGDKIIQVEEMGQIDPEVFRIAQEDLKIADAAPIRIGLWDCYSI